MRYLCALIVASVAWAQTFDAAPPGVGYQPKPGLEAEAWTAADSLNRAIWAARGKPNESALRVALRPYQARLDSIWSAEWVSPVADSLSADKVLAGKFTVKVQGQVGGHQVLLIPKVTPAELDSVRAMFGRIPVPADMVGDSIYASGPGFSRYTLPVLRAAVLAADRTQTP